MKHRRWLRGQALLGVAVLLGVPISAAQALGLAPAAFRTALAGPGPCDWPMFGGNAARTMTSACPSAPSTASVGSLLPRWHYHTSNVVTATPTIVGGVVYVGDWSGQFYALDLHSGTLRWSTTLGPRRADGQADHHTGAYGTITSSAAVTPIGRRLLAFVGAGDSLYALDATSAALPDAARVVWRTDLDPAHPQSHGEIESSPVVWAGAPGGAVVFVGSDANQDSGYVGEGMWAIRAATGHVLWHFNPEVYTHHSLFGCGNVWSSPALSLDPANPNPARRAMLYFGTADCPNNSPKSCPTDGSDRFCRPGHAYHFAGRWQPYAESVMALSAVTGTPAWSYQGHPPGSSDDDDYGASAQLFKLPSGQAVVGEAGKDGFYVVLDRATGRLVWRAAETGNGNLERGFALGGFIGTTAVLGVGGAPRVFGGTAINTPVTFDPATGNPILQPLPTILRGLVAMSSFSGVNGATAWSAVQTFTYGPTSAANGVVYVGALDGMLRGYDAATGSLRWIFPLGAPVSSGAAIGAGTVVIGAGTSESDLEFKLCDQLPASLGPICRQTPLNQTLNPLGDLGEVWAFATS